MREHAYLPAMVRFMRHHVHNISIPTGHGRAHPSLRNSRTRPSPRKASASISTQRAPLSANPILACLGVQSERFSCEGTFRYGAVSLTHLQRTLCMCVNIAAIVRTLPGGFAFQTLASKCSISNWFIRSFAVKIRAAGPPGSVPFFAPGFVDECKALLLRIFMRKNLSRSARFCQQRDNEHQVADGWGGHSCVLNEGATGQEFPRVMNALWFAGS